MCGCKSSKGESAGSGVVAPILLIFFAPYQVAQPR
jgi:hypothetical protein